MKMFILIAVLFLVATFEFASWMTYGGFAPEQELDVYLGEHLDGYTLNPYDRGQNLLSAPKYEQPYISAVVFSFFGKWQIKDHGRVPYWSKWSKKISEHRNQLIKDNPVKEPSLLDKM